MTLAKLYQCESCKAYYESKERAIQCHDGYIKVFIVDMFVEQQ